MSLQDVKTLLGVDDERIDIIYTKVEQRLLSRLNRTIETLDIIPQELEYIVDEVAIVRFNRLGSEGLQSESMDGHSATYIDADFQPYEADINDYINLFADPKKRCGEVYMRADTLVYFVAEGEEVYNPITGDYEDGEPIKTDVYALVTDTGTERMNLLYGGIKQHAKTIRLNQVCSDDFDYIVIDGDEYKDKKFQVDMKRIYRHKTTFEVSGL